MNFSLLVFAVAAFTSVSATPMADDVSVAMRSEDPPLEARLTFSGCYYFASSTCRVATVCMCAGFRIYYVNKENQNCGLHGCDSPWGYIGTGHTSYPGACCHIVSDNRGEKDVDGGPVKNIEASLVE